MEEDSRRLKLERSGWGRKRERERIKINPL